jgi:hypothetical protein
MKNKAKLHAIGFALAAMLMAARAQAQTLSRVYVSSKVASENTSTCGAFSSPCRYLNTAYNRVSAGGEIVLLYSGDYYNGQLGISKAVSIIAAEGVDASLVTTGNTAISVSAGSTDNVVIRGLTIRTTATSTNTFGITVSSGKAVQIENCKIRNFSTNSNSAGIKVDVSSDVQVSIKDTTLRNNYHGVLVVSSSSSVINKTTLERVRLIDNTTGVLAKDNASVTARDTIASGGTEGFKTVTSTSSRTAEISLEDCLAFDNSYGIKAEGVSGATSRVYASNCTIINNTTGVNADANSAVYSRTNNTLEGNGTAGTVTAYSAN